MKKIAYISPANPFDRHSWSGTIYSTYKELSKYYELVPITIKYNKLIKFFVRLVNKMIYVFTKKTYMPDYSSRFMVKLATRKLEKKLEKNNFNLLFIVCLSPVIPFINTNIPIVYMSDSVFKLMENYYYFNMNKWNLHNGNEYEKKSLKKSAAVIVASEWAKNGAVSYGVEPDKIFTIPLGANIDETIEKNIPIEHEINKNIHLLFIGIDWPRKGGNIAIETVKLLNERNVKTHFELEIIGGHPEYSVVDKNIHLHGFINKNDKNGRCKFIEIISKSQILLLPTKAECAGIAFAEASCYGLPTVTYDTGGVGTYVREGINGYKLPLESKPIDFAKKIEEIFSDNVKYKRLCTTSRELFEKELNWQHWGEKAMGIINNLISEKN